LLALAKRAGLSTKSRMTNSSSTLALACLLTV